MQRGIEYLRALSLTLVDPVSGQAVEAIPLSAIEAEAAQGAAPLDEKVRVGCYRCARSTVPLLVDPKGVIYCADIIDCVKAERRLSEGAAPRAEGHTQDCINAFYSDGGQSGCICGADRCSWTIRCEGEIDHSGPHHSKDRFAAPRAEGLDRKTLSMALHSLLPMDPGHWTVWQPNDFGGGKDVRANSAEFADLLLARLSRPSDGVKP